MLTRYHHSSDRAYQAWQRKQGLCSAWLKGHLITKQSYMAVKALQHHYEAQKLAAVSAANRLLLGLYHSSGPGSCLADCQTVAFLSIVNLTICLPL
jgi:hypothetical protein